MLANKVQHVNKAFSEILKGVFFFIFYFEYVEQMLAALHCILSLCQASMSDLRHEIRSIRAKIYLKYEVYVVVNQIFRCVDSSAHTPGDLFHSGSNESVL